MITLNDWETLPRKAQIAAKYWLFGNDARLTEQAKETLLDACELHFGVLSVKSSNGLTTKIIVRK